MAPCPRRAVHSSDSEHNRFSFRFEKRSLTVEALRHYLGEHFNSMYLRNVFDIQRNTGPTTETPNLCIYAPHWNESWFPHFHTCVLHCLINVGCWMLLQKCYCLMQMMLESGCGDDCDIEAVCLHRSSRRRYFVCENSLNISSRILALLRCLPHYCQFFDIISRMVCRPTMYSFETAEGKEKVGGCQVQCFIIMFFLDNS